MTFVQNPGSASPVFDYTSRDYTSILTDLLSRQRVYLPEWTSQNNNDFGVVLLEMFAYNADLLHYYMDRLANESFIQTATQPQSVLNLAAMLGYTPYLSVGAAVNLQIQISPTMPAGSYPVDIPAGSQFSTQGTNAQAPIIFTTTQDASFPISGPFVQSVDAVQGVQYVNEAVATSDGSINQIYRLKYNPVSADSITVSVDLGTGPQEWGFVGSLINAGPYAYAWSDWVDANQVFYVTLGDGVNGYVPPIGSPITATYMTNSGGLGNVGANTIVNYVGPPLGTNVPRPLGIIGITNPAAANGGAYAESVSSIQVNAPASLRTLERGVTLQDIQTLAQSISGFVWASAVEQTYQVLNLYMCPNGGGQLSELQIIDVLNAMSPVVMANTTLNVLSAVYIPVDITVNVTAYANFSNQGVTSAVTAALQDMLALPNTGFGFRLGLGLVYQTVDSVPGVNWSVVSTLTREVLVTLAAPLTTTGGVVTQLQVSELPQALGTSGDQLTLIDTGQATPPTQQINATPTGAPAGAFQIPVVGFTPIANFSALTTTVMDTTLLTDAVFLDSEIPVIGSKLTVNVSGGTTP